jgi:Uma2 family endonuclease
MLVHAYPVQRRSLTVEEYLKLPETEGGREELEFGWIVREPPPHAVWHQFDAGQLADLLKTHLRRHDLGFAFDAAGVVLDRAKALVLIPDISVLIGERVKFASDQIWGPPNIVVEVASPSTRARDRQQKLAWYRAYGVEECWLVDAREGFIEVHRLGLPAGEAARMFRGDEIVESGVLPAFRLPVSQLLANDERARLARFRYDKARS